MSDNETTNEAPQPVEVSQPVLVQPQVSATDTANWDTKISTDPSGERYIRTLPEEE